MLTDFLVASPEDAPDICAAGGERGKRWPCAMFKRVDPVKLATLWELLAPGKTSNIAGGDSMLCEADSGEAWVFSLPPTFVTSLANLDASRFGEVGARWAKTEELIADRFSSDDAIQVIESLSALAKESLVTDKALLLWLCV